MVVDLGYAAPVADAAFINLEDLTEADLEVIKIRYAALAEKARAKSGLSTNPGTLPSESEKA